MFIEQPPLWVRLLFGKTWWRHKQSLHTVYITFDDGPIPEVTPWVLDILDQYNVKATFFCVGDNVIKHNTIYQDIIQRGHAVGNHTMHHLRGFKYSVDEYLEDVEKASQVINSPLFRPPHGQVTYQQRKALEKKYQLVMWDVVTRDYNKKLNGEDILNKVRKYTRNGSIIVFHDSLRAENNVRYALPKTLAWLQENGYICSLLPSCL